MVEIQFSDGVAQVDDLYVPLLKEATDGKPQEHTQREAMRLMGRVQEKRVLRDAQADVLRGHFQR
jgi:hypothetical protein